MKRIQIAGLITFLVLFLNIVNTRAELLPEEIYRNTEGAIVYISVYDYDNILLRFASGVVVNNDGVIYTNYHVIKNASRIEVRSGRTIVTDVKMISINPSTDAAILKIPPGILSYIKISDSGFVSIGQKIYAIGNPHGMEKTFSSGLVSSFRVFNDNMNIQFTASISPGSSGGALLNSDGELVGISSSYFPGGQSLNFALPIDDFKRIELIDHNDSSQVNMMNSVCRMYFKEDDETDMQRDTLFSEICRLGSNTEYYFEFTGNLFTEFGETDSAIAYYTKGIEVYPESKALYKLRADSRTTVDLLEEGLLDYQKAIEIDSNCIECYLSRAWQYKNTLDRKEKAIDDYTLALKLDPANYYIYLERADAYLDLKDTLNAIADLNNTFILNEKDHYTFGRMASMFSSLGYNDDAVAYYTLALKDNDDPFYLMQRGVIYSKVENYLLAAKDYLDYLEYNPYDVTAYNNLGYCYLGEEEFDLAEKYFNKSLKYDKHHFDSYIGLSVMNYRKGNIRKSIINMASAIELESVLAKGIPGLDYLRDKGYFWVKRELKDIKNVFKLMGLETKKRKITIKPKAEKIRAESSE